MLIRLTILATPPRQLDALSKIPADIVIYITLFLIDLLSQKRNSINLLNRTEVIMPNTLVIRANDGGRIRTYKIKCSIQA